MRTITGLFLSVVEKGFDFWIYWNLGPEVLVLSASILGFHFLAQNFQG